MYTSIINNSESLQDKLIENYYILNQIIHSINTGTVIVFEKKIIHINNETRKISQRTYKEMENGIHGIVCHNDIKKVLRAYTAVLRNFSNTCEIVFNIIMPDKTTKRLEAKFCRIKIIEKTAVLVMLHEKNSSINFKYDGRITQQFWRQYRTEYSSLFADKHDFIILLDKNYLVTNISKKIEYITGINPQNFIGKRLDTIININPLMEFAKTINDFSLMANNEYSRAIKKIRVELTPPNEQKSIYQFCIAAVNIYSKHEGYCIVAKSETELENKKHYTKDNLPAFISNISHEFRSPLNAIIGFSNIITDENLSPHERNLYLRYIKQSCNSLLNIVNDLVDINKIDQDKITISKTFFSINKLFDELEAYCVQYKHQFNKPKIKIIKSQQYTDSEFKVLGDAQRISQIMINLLCNAFKFTEKGFVKYEYHTQNNNGKQELLLTVSDTGIGIPKDKQSIIFNRFEQISNQPKYNGIGLGLSITKNLVELMKGTITLESEQGKGSTFKITLPTQTADFQTDIQKIQKQVTNNGDLAGKTIIIAEDAQINFILLQKILMKTGAKILWAKNGEECIETFKNNPNANLILMDMQMPIKDGYAATKEILKLDGSVPVIAQTAFSMADEKKRILECGCIDYISKPIDRAELLKKIKTVIR